MSLSENDFQNGLAIDSKRNLKQVQDFYENNIYGKWRSGEKVSYAIHEKSVRPAPDTKGNPFAAMFQLSTTDEGKDVEIFVEAGGKKVSFTVRAYLPVNRRSDFFTDGNPFIICMHPIQPKDYALENGYGVIFMDTSMVAQDNNLRKGCFYDLYPYGTTGETQTGELMAWSWAASKVLDAIYSGLDKEFGLNKELSIVTGVSRWGKATAVCGAFEKRFKLTVPTCSGAGGLALWNYFSEGKSYDLSCCGGPKDYVYGKNEPLGSLQSSGEQGWFNDAFLLYKTSSEIPVDQYMLPVLASGQNRYYFIVAAWMGEDWVNAPAMWECYKLAKEHYKKLGVENHIDAHFHKEGHAVLQEDLEKIFPFFESRINS